jgi:N-acetylneuraminate synthase
MKTVTIGDKVIGGDDYCFIVAEIGINHNGDINIAKKLIDVASFTGCDAVKFQKRTVDLVYTPEELAKPRENPFGPTNRDLKKGLEFERDEYDEINAYCKQKNLLWFTSCWDRQSVDLIDRYAPPCFKIASACLTDDRLLRHTRGKGRPVILSTGMSTLEQIDHAVEVLGKKDLILLHCTSTYPGKLEELNLKAIKTLRDKYAIPVGYSGHEVGLAPSLVAVAIGACLLERHITLDRAMWGSDQAASIEPQGVMRLVRDVRVTPTVLGDGIKKVYESERPILQKLRRVK